MGCNSSSARNLNITDPVKNKSKASVAPGNEKKESLTLYYFPMSQPSRTVLSFLELVGIKHEKKVVDILKGEQKAPEYLKINPNGVVPSIDDDGFKVFESETIIRYLINTRKVGTDLYSPDPKTAALVDRYLPFHHSEIRPACMNFFYASFNFLFPDVKLTLEGTKPALEETIKKFDDIYLVDKKYITGDKLSIADLFAMGELSMVYYTTNNFDFTKYPRVKAYIDRVAENKTVNEVNKPVIEFPEVIKKMNTASSDSKSSTKPEETKSVEPIPSKASEEKAKVAESNPQKVSDDQAKSSLTLYYSPMSQPSRAVLSFLQLTGIKHERKVIDILKGENKTPEYLKINPNGLVPAIDDAGFQVPESETIIRYLINTRNVGTDLYPADPKTRALIDRYLPFHHGSVRPACMSFFYATFSFLFPKDQQLTLEATTPPLEEVLNKLDSIHLGDKKYLAGDNLSIADLFAMGELTMISLATPFDFTKYPRVNAYIDRVTQNPIISEINKPVAEFPEILKKMNPDNQAKTE